MVKQTDEWIRVDKTNRCPICESDSWCTVSADGVVAICMFVKSDRPKTFTNGDVGYIHKLKDDVGPMILAARRKKPPRKHDAELHVRFAPLCRSWYVNQSARIEALAKELSVPAWAFDAIKVGWDGEAWTFPELNHRGQIIGVNRRLADGKKICVVGSRRGLTYADCWCPDKVPVIIVEGGSDTAAGIAMGLSVVGRPSNIGGVDYLARLLKGLDRPMCIIAEQDRKEHDTLAEVVRRQHDPKCTGCRSCWPGKAGAIAMSMSLSKRLNRIVQWSFPPDGAKDLRAWMVSRGVDRNNQAGLERIGKSFLRRVRNVKHQ